MSSRLCTVHVMETSGGLRRYAIACDERKAPMICIDSSSLQESFWGESESRSVQEAIASESQMPSPRA